MTAPITVKDVARAAEVSVGTVSRVLRGEVNVMPETEKRVREAAARLNYKRLRRPKTAGNPKTASKKGRRLTNVSLLMLGMDRTLTNLPCVADAIHGAECELAKSGVRVTLSDLPFVDRLPESLGPTDRIDGILAKGALQGDLVDHCDDALVSHMRAIPTVWLLGRPAGADWGDVVESNDSAIGRIAAEYLLRCGHRNVAILNPKPDHVLFAHRAATFQWHATRGGANVHSFLGESSDWTFPLRTVDANKPVESLFDDLWDSQTRPTAIFTPADSIAALVYRNCARRGLRIGKDISLISCNNESPLIAGLFPQLTTIDVGATAIGRQAAQRLAMRVRHPAEPCISVSVEPRLMVGESVRIL